MYNISRFKSAQRARLAPQSTAGSPPQDFGKVVRYAYIDWRTDLRTELLIKVSPGLTYRWAAGDKKWIRKLCGSPLYAEQKYITWLVHHLIYS